MSFNGKVVIHGKKVGRPNQRITLHQNGLAISKASILKHEKQGTRVIQVQRINKHTSFDEVRLHASEVLYPGNYEVSLEFKGAITRPMNGIYPCFFKNNGKNKVLIATQFESHYARQAFPCIDEPEAKATFQLSLTTSVGETVISNTLIKSQEKTKTRMLTTFETTPKMSTYLLAFIYGDLSYNEAKTKSGITVRAYATPSNVTHTEYALEIATKCLDFFEQYYDLPYPLAKCDLIALPDFSSGAMENWGCVTFREQTLLIDPRHASLPTKQYVTMVVAHELAHQWFGNLVTMRWWSDLWLNEGFASWMEYLATNHLFPNWHMWTEFLINEQEVGMKLDALESTHPIEVKVNHPEEIHTIFDSISYSKGSSIINMLHTYLGADKFRDGLRKYLKHHAYANTDTTDLWAAFESSSGKPVKEFAHVWTSQPGFPVVTPKTVTSGVVLHQQRFFINPSKHGTQRWPIPLQSKLLPKDSLLDTDTVFEISSTSTLQLNQSRSGFYRVAYDPKNLHELFNLNLTGNINELDRLGLLSDAFETSKAGYISTVRVLEILLNYKNDVNNFIWEIVAGGLSSIRLVMRDERLRESMKPFIWNLVTEQYERLGWKESLRDTHGDILLRPIILSLASIADDPSAVKTALNLFTNLKQSSNLHPDLRGVVYGTVARKGSDNEFNKMLAFHDQSQNSEERLALTIGITGFRQKKLIERVLTHIKSPEVRLQDAMYWIAYSLVNRYARDITWEWLMSNWDWLEQHIGEDLSFFQLPLYAARAYSERSFIPVYKKFFAKHHRPGLDRSIRQGLEIIEWQSAWRERDLASLIQFFTK